MIKKLFNKSANDLIDSVGDTIDKVFTNDEEKIKGKEKLTELVLFELNKLYATQGDVVKTEMSGNWMQRNWRPLTMLTFVVILVCKWFGWTDETIPIQLEDKLMTIVEIGIGGYIGGRTLEKVAEKVTKNTDLTFLKKKDRKDKIG